MKEYRNYMRFNHAYDKYAKNTEDGLSNLYPFKLRYMHPNKPLNKNQTKFLLATPTAYIYVEKRSERWEYDYDESWKVYKLKDPEGNVFEWSGKMYNSLKEVEEAADNYIKAALDCIDKSIKHHQGTIDILEELEGKLHEISNANKREN